MKDELHEYSPHAVRSSRAEMSPRSLPLPFQWVRTDNQSELIDGAGFSVSSTACYRPLILTDFVNGASAQLDSSTE